MSNESFSQRLRSLLSNDLIIPALKMCMGFIIHDALQERMFRYEGFEFGSFMTFIEVVVMLVVPVLIRPFTKKLHAKRKGNQRIFRPTFTILLTTALIGLCIAISHGCGNTALLYSTYPLKVAFKSCKLVPTMLLGMCLTQKRYQCAHYIAATVMCVGLMQLTVVDSISSSSDTDGSSTKTESGTADSVELTTVLGSSMSIGPFLLLVSTILDAVVPNLQERLFKTCETDDVMFWSNACMFCMCLPFIAFSGELALSVTYCWNKPESLAVLCLQGLCAFVGLQGYLEVIRSHGGVAAIIMANARKVITIVLSFTLFRKPFTQWHVFGLILISLGIFLGVKVKSTQKASPASGILRSPPLSGILSPPPLSGNNKKTDDEDDDDTINSRDSII